jgi:hypothetical protein
MRGKMILKEIPQPHLFYKPGPMEDIRITQSRSHILRRDPAN